MSHPTAENRLMTEIGEVCPKNPRKGTCCTHPEEVSDDLGIVSRRQRCCWCGVTGTWSVVLIPNHGPRAPKHYDPKGHSERYP